MKGVVIVVSFEKTYRKHLKDFNLPKKLDVGLLSDRNFQNVLYQQTYISLNWRLITSTYAYFYTFYTANK